MAPKFAASRLQSPTPHRLPQLLQSLPLLFLCCVSLPLNRFYTRADPSPSTDSTSSLSPLSSLSSPSSSTPPSEESLSTSSALPALSLTSASSSLLTSPSICGNDVDDDVDDTFDSFDSFSVEPHIAYARAETEEAAGSGSSRGRTAAVAEGRMGLLDWSTGTAAFTRDPVATSTSFEETGRDITSTSSSRSSGSSGSSGRSGGSGHYSSGIGDSGEDSRRRELAGAAGAKKPCLASKVTIAVRSGPDIAKRVLYPPTTTVTLLLYNSITLRRGLVFARNFSCTILRAASGMKKTPSIHYLGSAMPVFTAFNTSNILVTGVRLSLRTSNKSLPCTGFGPFQDARQSMGQLCPGILIVRSFGIQITKGSVYGRVDVFRSIYVVLDSLSVTMPLYAYSTSHPWYSFDTLGIVRIGANGVGARLLKSNVVISNCEVYGGWELITLFKGAAGVTVRNNYLHDYYWAGVRCGAYSGYVMDCYLNTISYNYIIGSPDTIIIDSASVYFGTHWYNPGNLVKCNYMLNGVHCYYLDYASSGIRIDGGVCKNTADTLKLNNGKYNKVSSLVIVSNPGVFYESFYISCISAKRIQCNKNGEGKYWKDMFNLYYNKPNVNRLYPYMRQLCPPPTRVNGAPCNPATPGALPPVETGSCSGLPYANNLDLIMVNTAHKRGTMCSATEYPTIFKINTVRLLNVTHPRAAGFINPAKNDYGVRRGSNIYRKRPGFTSCPRSQVGPKWVLSSEYYAKFNIARPYWFQAMLDFDMTQILNVQLYLRVGIPK